MSVIGQKWLLDTNVLLAALIKPEALSTDTQTLLQNPESTVYFSAASLWEIAINHSLKWQKWGQTPYLHPPYLHHQW